MSLNRLLSMVSIKLMPNNCQIICNINCATLLLYKYEVNKQDKTHNSMYMLTSI